MAEWYEFHDNIRFLATHLCSLGADGWTIFDLFEKPWDFTEQYNEAFDNQVDFELGFGL